MNVALDQKSLFEPKNMDFPFQELFYYCKQAKVSDHCLWIYLLSLTQSLMRLTSRSVRGKVFNLKSTELQYDKITKKQKCALIV